MSRRQPSTASGGAVGYFIPLCSAMASVLYIADNCHSPGIVAGPGALLGSAVWRRVVDCLGCAWVEVCATTACLWASACAA